MYVRCPGLLTTDAAAVVHDAARCCICCQVLAVQHCYATADANTADASAGAPATSVWKAHPAPLIPARCKLLLHPIYSVQCMGVSQGAPALLFLPGMGLLQLLSRPHSDLGRCLRHQGNPSQLASTATVQIARQQMRLVSVDVWVPQQQAHAAPH